ncbi:MAG: protein kinase [Deltaproteobacteria bacterium]|nr:protein kinase [Deltaproteobacteria bacterium]
MHPGDVIADRFEVQRFAGQGGIGTVYQCRDLINNRKVAIKVLQHHPETEKARFLREAKLLSKFTHPAIVRYLAHGTTADGGMFLAMDWLEGEDLCSRLIRERLSVEQSVNLIRRAAQALAAAHDNAVIHRDIKPSNLFLLNSDPEQVVVLDFGIARQLLATQAMTTTGIVLGTIGYMAPEQARGDQSIDARVDIFALGCVFFECLTGKPAFPGTNFAAVLAKVLYEEVPEVRELRPEVSKPLSELVARMLAKNREKRPKNASELLVLLDDIHPVTSLGPPSVSYTAEVLTSNEQRLLSVALISLAHISEEDTRVTLATLRTIVRPLEGEFALLTNDCAMIMLKGYGNAADQAIYAAAYSLSMHAATPGSRVALATGRAEIAGQWPVGQVIDRAAELLEEAAKSSEEAIFIDEATAGLIEGRYEISGEGPVRLLLGERASLQSARRLLGKPTPCVGRQTELAFLDSILEECIEEPEAKAVLIISPPGVGKSRLRHEFIERVTARGDRVHILTARGDPVYSGSAFVLASQLIRHATQLAEGEPEEKQLATLKAHLQKLFDEQTLRQMVEFLAEILRVPATDAPSPQLIAARNDPAIMNEQLHNAFEDWLGAICRKRGALLLVLEDLHWGDLPTVTFIESALKKHTEAPIMVLALARPEIADVFPKLWSNFGVQEIQLQSLKRRAAERLARRVLGDEVSETTINRIVEQADGNAFFLEELIRHVAKGIESNLPETVVAMVQSRLEGLDREARKILRAASVFGEVFWEGGVGALLGDSMPLATVSRWLDVLVEQEFLMPHRLQKFTSERAFEFRHDLFREAAHAMLTESDRILGHRLSAQWLEKAGEKDALVLADHFEQGGEKRRAIRYFLQAAQAAYDGGNFKAIFPIAERGLNCGAQGEERGGLLMLMAKRYAVSDELCKAPELASEALTLLAKGSAPWFDAVAVLSLVGSFEGNIVSTMRALEAYQSHKGPVPATGPAGLASWVLYGCLVHGGQGDTAQRLLDRLENEEEQIGPPDPAFTGYLCVARSFSALFGFNHLGDALPNATRALQLFEEAQDKIGQCLALYLLGWAQIAIGEHATGEETCRTGLDRARNIDFAWAKNKLTLVLASGQLIREQAQAALSTLRPLLESSDTLSTFLARIYRSLALFQQGDGIEAARDLELALQSSSIFPTVQTQALVVSARIELGLNRFENAIEHCKEALRMSEGGGLNCIFEPMLRLTLSQALTASGRNQEAAEALRCAYDYLMKQAASLYDSSQRDRYLAHSRETVRIIELARSIL